MPNETTAPTQTSSQGSTASSTSVTDNPFAISPQETSAPEPTTPEVTPSQTPAQTQPTQTQQPVTPATTSPQQTLQTPDIASQIREGIIAAEQARLQVQQQQTQQQQANRPISDQEFAQQFRIPQVDATAYEAMFGAPPPSPQAVTALNEFSQNTIRSAVLMANTILESKMKVLDQQLSVLSSAHQQQLEKQHTQTFFEKYPDLKNEGPLLQTIRDAAMARGMKFNTIEEAMEFGATQARQIITNLRGGQPDVTQTQQSQAMPKTPVRTMTPTSMGGRSGTGGTQQSKSTAEQIFGS